MTKKNDIIKKLFFEADSYRDLKDLDQLSELGIDFSSIPLQPLYLLLKSAPLETRASVLEKLSVEQRQAIYDIEGWDRDDLDLETLKELPLTIVKSGNLKIIQEFASSDLFLLYLKGSFTVYTFDHEEANYPENDNFFITDDNAFIIEYNEGYELVEEIQYLIKNLYADLGVNGAFHLFMELISQSYTIALEEEYQIKKGRLRDYGFVDVYEAKEMTAEFRSKEQLEIFIKNKQLTPGELTALSKSQALHSKSMRGLVDGLDELGKELSKLDDDKKVDFLQFDFIRLVNGTLAANDAFKKGSLAFTKVNKETQSYLRLGFEYTKKEIAKAEDSSLFEDFTFIDLYKVGKTLVKIEQTLLNKALDGVDEDFENFIGTTMGDIVDVFSSDLDKLTKDLPGFESFQEQSSFLRESLPYIKQFYENLNELKSSDKLNDNFYMNYTVDEIDFESILLSSLINFSLGLYEDAKNLKMGVSIEELKSWTSKYLIRKQEQYLLASDPNLMKTISEFQKRFGLDTLNGFDHYMITLLDHHLTGYDFQQLEFSEFKHIGGPILLNIN